jgi:MFS family permease
MLFHVTRQEARSDETAHVPPITERARHAGALVFGAVVSWWVASPGFGHLGDRIVGDNGDAMWQLSVMRWTLDGLRSLHLPWTPPMYFPATSTYAYSDPILMQAFVAAPFRALGGSPAFVSNAVLLISWTAAVYFAWRLLRRVCPNDAIALAGATAWAFSELRIGTVVLFQLVTAAALLPLVFELLFALLGRPSLSRGAALGAAMTAAILAALYYGPLLAATVPVATIAWFVVTRERPARAHAFAAGLALVITALAVLPIAAHYQHVHDRDHLDRKPEAAFSAELSDFNDVSSHHGVLASVPGLGRAVSGERALFPGLLVVVAVPVGMVLIVRRRRNAPARLHRELIALVAAGATAYLLSAGIMLDRLPGFGGIRAPARFAILGHLGLVAVACVVLELGTRRIPSRRLAGVAVAALVVVSCADVGSRVPTAIIPAEARWSAVDHALDELPGGPVAELPLFQSSDGPLWPRGEAPRLYLAGIDGNRRVNGYSGFQPPGFDALATTLNEFPAPDAVATLQRLHVRYVILRTDIVGARTYDPRTLLAYYGTSDRDRLFVTPDRLTAILGGLPPSVIELGEYGNAVLLEVLPDRDRGGP